MTAFYMHDNDCGLYSAIKHFAFLRSGVEAIIMVCGLRANSLLSRIFISSPFWGL